MLASSAVLVANLFPSIAAQDRPEKRCGGLHAALRAEFVKRDPPYTEPPFVMLTFILLNDGDAPLNTVAGPWVVVIDGVELPDRGIDEGPMPIGGYGTLNPGQFYEFGKAFPVREFFPQPRDYKVSWKGKDFQSSTIKVSVPANPK